MIKNSFLLSAAAVLIASNTLAATTHLSEFNWDDPVSSGRNAETAMEFSATSGGENRNSCIQQCPGYSMTITECSAGYELKSCESANCTEYHKCEPNGCAPGYDTELKDCPIDVQEDNYLCSKCID